MLSLETANMVICLFYYIIVTTEKCGLVNRKHDEMLLLFYYFISITTDVAYARCLLFCDYSQCQNINHVCHMKVLINFVKFTFCCRCNSYNVNKLIKVNFKI